MVHLYSAPQWLIVGHRSHWAKLKYIIPATVSFLLFCWLLRLTGHHILERVSTQQVAQPTIGKVSMVYGNVSVYERALQTHAGHSRRFGYPEFVLRKKILGGYWSKNAILMSVLLQELQRPEGQRLEWIFWFDADTVLMNPNIPLETFLPPPHLSHIHLLVSKDWNGLNNGVFFIRVHPWSLKLLTAASAYPILKPEVHLVWQDQSALAELFKMEYFSSSVVFCPLRWFNAYPEDWLEAGRSSASSSHLHLQPGDLLVHFPGTSREKLNETMMPYIEIAEGHQKAWELRLGETYYQTEIESFWKNMSSNVTRFWPHGAIASSPVSGP